MGTGGTLTLLTGEDLCGDEEGDPGDDDEESRWEIVVDDVVHDVADEHHLEAGQAVVAEGAALEHAVALGKTSVGVGRGRERESMNSYPLSLMHGIRTKM